ncbi:2-keto-myo-inositol dehydratase [Rhizobium tibeticum]|uniref:2-keto-myo-inositol dehydratase n=1 Tax=Rhizobium tibeticum TaxID=501024 RepID=A0ABY1AY08_9HYPH|nr:myo-inosose-2 dehydratase [Rhizobium tibeticum]SEP29607.1 2-keto-myo-inositol dehydratase [Rhizobium tibeticum]
MSTQTSRLSPEKVWLGITPTLWWNDDFINIDIGIPFEQCISEMALAGYVGCSVGHKYPTDRKTLKAALDLRGLRVSEPWVSTYFTIAAMRKQTIQKVRQQLAFLQEMEGGSEDPRKADLVVAEFGHAVNPLPVALFPNCPNLTDGQWDQLLDGLHDIGRIAKEEGRRLCYHPHLGTGVMAAEAIDRLMENTETSLVHLLLDTGHLAAAGVDPLAVTKRYASRIKHIHLKDIRADVVARIHADGLSFESAIEAGIFTVPGDGSITTFPQILTELAEVGFAGWLVIEAEQAPAKANPLQYAKMARAYLRETLGW